MYQLEYLPIARHDMVEIVKYISQVLGNPSAAENFADEMIQASEKLTELPYIYPVHRVYNRTYKPLKHEYCKLKIKSYIMFYYVDEKKKIVVFAGVLYSRRDYEKLL